ncbi:hypothetical protein [Enterococcus mundtii]|uniref:hypothetical protein n=1 Tax=Enterococcus mundtii TaxID=53346 RepID=UPI001378C7C3|nr:hypothetical protein [Enterococcus mundtii]NBA63219.1 hypothetical protein [Enterococcus mundtii]
MNQRFEYNFEDVEPKLLKKGKGLKKKNKYTLKQAEALVGWIQHNWGEKTTITLVCSDVEEGTKYAFDGIEITPFSIGGQEKLLFSDIEGQILQAPDSMISDPNKLILDINDQYKHEPDVAEPTKETKSKINLKLPSVVLPFSKKKNKLMDELIEPEETDVYEEQLEIEELDVSSEETEEVEETEEIETVSIDEEETEEIFDFEDEEEVENEHKKPMSTSSLGGVVAVNDPQSPPSMTSQSANYSPQYQAPNALQPVRKHETVQLVTLKEYCDLGEEIETSISQMVEKLKPESLFKFIGIPSTGLTNTRIDEYRSNHAMLRLAEVKFENLREHYSRQIISFKAEALDRLRTAVDIAWKKPYDLDVKKNKAEELSKMEAEAEAKLNEFVKRQENNVNDKIKKFEIEQEIDLKNFIARQEADKAVFIATEKDRTQNLIDSKAESINAELFETKDKFIDEEMYKMKIEMNKNLFDGKQKIKSELATELAKANDNVWENALKFIQEIQDEIEAKTPIWAAEIKEFNSLEEQEHERMKQTKELQLKEESIEIKRLEAEMNLKRMEELDHENKMLKIKLETALSKNELLAMEQDTNQVVNGSNRVGALNLFSKR